MLAQQLNTGVPWDMLLDFVVSFLVWGTVVSGLILVVRDCMEADPFHRHHPLETHSHTPTGISVVEYRGCMGCTIPQNPQALEQKSQHDKQTVHR